MHKPKTISTARNEDALKTCLPGLQATERYSYPYHLPTQLGTLWVAPCDGAIRICFEAVPTAAPCGTHLNPYSGKWNFEGIDTDDDLSTAIHWIGRITSC